MGNESTESPLISISEVHKPNRTGAGPRAPVPVVEMAVRKDRHLEERLGVAGGLVVIPEEMLIVAEVMGKPADARGVREAEEVGAQLALGED